MAFFKRGIDMKKVIIIASLIAAFCVFMTADVTMGIDFTFSPNDTTTKIGYSPLRSDINDILPPSFLPQPQEGGEVVHVVVWGDTLYSIARRYETTVNAIMEANNLDNPSYIYRGQRLAIPGGESQAGEQGDEVVAPSSPEPSQAGGTHIVSRGDTLGSLAIRYGTTVNAIMKANNLSDPNYIYRGQRLAIPSADIYLPTPKLKSWYDQEYWIGQYELDLRSKGLEKFTYDRSNTFLFWVKQKVNSGEGKCWYCGDRGDIYMPTGVFAEVYYNPSSRGLGIIYLDYNGRVQKKYWPHFYDNLKVELRYREKFEPIINVFGVVYESTQYNKGYVLYDYVK